jgi:hypothetical protein
MNQTDMTDLQINIPSTLAECVGYYGQRRWFVLYIADEEIFYDDGSMSGTASSAGYETFTGHIHIAPRLYRYYQQTLVIDREQNKLYCAPHAAAITWLHQENGGPPAQLEDLEQLAALLDTGSWSKVHIDDAEIEQRVAEMRRQIEEMHTWISGHIPPPPPELLQWVQDDIQTRLQRLQNPS